MYLILLKAWRGCSFEKKDASKVDVLIVGAGLAGLACAIPLKKARPEIRVCVVEKSADLGGHNLSGAVLESGPLHRLLDEALGDWQQTEQAKELLSRKVTKDQVMFLAGRKWSLGISFAVTLAKLFRLGFGQMKCRGDYIVSVSKLTKWIGDIARQLGVEIATSFGVEDIIWDQDKCTATGVRLTDQGRDKEGNPLLTTGLTLDGDNLVATTNTKMKVKWKTNPKKTPKVSQFVIILERDEESDGSNELQRKTAKGTTEQVNFPFKDVELEQGEEWLVHIRIVALDENKAKIAEDISEPFICGAKKATL